MLKKIIIAFVLIIFASPVFAANKFVNFFVVPTYTAKALSGTMDSNMEASFIIQQNQLDLIIKNKTPNPIYVLWDNAAFVDTNSTSRQIFHNGVKFLDVGKPQANSVIPPYATIRDSVIPNSNIEFTGRYWHIYPLFRVMNESIYGKTFSLFLPMQIGNKILNYNFSFEITGMK